MSLKSSSQLPADQKGPKFGADALSYYLRLPQTKRLVHRLTVAQEDMGFTSVSVVSLFPREGRTFFVSLVALAYATVLKRRVLILDTISQSKEDSFHLSAVMKEHTSHPDIQDAMHSVPLQDSSGVDLVATRALRGELGSKNRNISPLQTAEFLMQPFLKALAPSYDLILLDTCAIRAVTGDHFDPLVLSRQVDQVITLVSAQSASEEALIELHNQLSKAEVPLLGYVRNEFEGF
jgi:Mrp family chromosome partitioning ATPase